MSHLWLHPGRVPGLSLHCLQASSLSSWHRAIPGMFLVLSVTCRDRDLPTGEAAGSKDASNLTMKRGTLLEKHVLTHISLKAEERAKITWAFPRSSCMQRSQSSTGSLRWLSSTPAICYHKPDRNLILCPLSSKHV